MTSSFVAAVTPKGKSVKFVSVGDEFTGKISAPVVLKQATEFGSNAPKFYPKSGDPIMEEIISLLDLNAPSEEEAPSTLYVSSPKMRQAIGEAILAAGATDLQVGGTLQLKFTGHGTGKNPSQPPKLYSARYAPPAPPAGGSWGGAE